ncbi:MAG: group II intron maturase-specific domain-containing protein [Thiogranum sp.]
MGLTSPFSRRPSLSGVYVSGKENSLDQAGTGGLQAPHSPTDEALLGDFDATPTPRTAAVYPGWINYFGLSEYYQPLPGLDEWIRRRLRMCYLKHWRKPRTCISNLIKLGTGTRTAVSLGLSPKGPYRLSRTLSYPAPEDWQWGEIQEALQEEGLLYGGQKSFALKHTTIDTEGARSKPHYTLPAEASQAPGAARRKNPAL